MNAETMLELAKDYTNWMRKSRDLRASADVLWDAYHAQARQWSKLQSVDQEEADLAWRHATAHLEGAKHFYALALETAFKAVIIRDLPDEPKFDVTRGTDGQILSVRLTHIGVNKNQGHDLKALAATTTVFEFGDGKLFRDSSESEQALRTIDDLTKFSMWVARYPIPTKANHLSAYPRLPLSDAWGDETRKWTDPILDHLLGAPKDS